MAHLSRGRAPAFLLSFCPPPRLCCASYPACCMLFANFVSQPINYKFDHSYVLDTMRRWPGKVRLLAHLCHSIECRIQTGRMSALPNMIYIFDSISGFDGRPESLAMARWRDSKIRLKRSIYSSRFLRLPSPSLLKSYSRLYHILRIIEYIHAIMSVFKRSILILSSSRRYAISCFGRGTSQIQYTSSLTTL